MGGGWEDSGWDDDTSGWSNTADDGWGDTDWASEAKPGKHEHFTFASNKHMGNVLHAEHNQCK